MNTEETMCAEWEKFCKDNSLPFQSADEVLVLCWEKLTREQRDYIQRFIARWDEMIRASCAGHVGRTI